MIGYIVDDLALIAGLTGISQEHHRREVSRLVHGAVQGGPVIEVPACCLAAAAVVRPALAGHMAELVAEAPPGAIEICGLTRSSHLDALRTFRPHLDWPAAHAAVHALTTGLPVVTTDTDRYVGLGIDVLDL